jgi:hypothetical protein
LPGYCFHVFSPVDDTAEYAREFDRNMAALVQKVRGVFKGKLIINGGISDFAFPGFADWMGVTTYDIGHPELPYNASVDDWKAAYEALFARSIDQVYQRWSKPVILYTVHTPSVPGDPDPTGQAAQARRLEGLFQALKGRAWVIGTLSWAYSMVDAPLRGDGGVRGQPAEAVLAKYYGLLSGH